MYSLEGMRHSSSAKGRGQKGEASPATFHSFLLNTIALYHSFIISFNACSFAEIVR